jgi:hypothetical protein
MSVTEIRKHAPTPPTSRRAAVLSGLLAAAVYLLLAYHVARLTEPSFSGGSYLLLYIYAVGAIGIPVAAWLRYGLRSPFAVMVAVLVFWHVLVLLFGNDGDAPVFAVALGIAPVYVIAYVLIGGVEYLFRRTEWRRSIRG